MSRERIDHAVLFLKSISQTPSGGDSQVFFGSRKKLWSLYKGWNFVVPDQVEFTLHRRFFLKKLRWMAGVQIRKGDQFVDSKWILLQEVQRDIQRLESIPDPNEADLNHLTKLRTFKQSLEDNNTDANWQISCYKEDIANLTPDQLILILDFTKFNQVKNHCFLLT